MTFRRLAKVRQMFGTIVHVGRMKVTIPRMALQLETTSCAALAAPDRDTDTGRSYQGMTP